MQCASRSCKKDTDLVERVYRVPPMRLITFSMVRNEADVIEAFVRHHTQWVDQMIIVMHRCRDGTEEILRALHKEGLPIEIRYYDAYSQDQHQVMTALLHEHAHVADWFLPLDADEFLLVPEGADPRTLLPDPSSDYVIKIPWRTYLPFQEDSGMLHPFERLQYRRKEECPVYFKVCIPRSLALEVGTTIDMGNHAVRSAAGNEVLFRRADLFLAHMPVRSERQLRTKVLGGWLSNLARSDCKKGEGFQWELLFERCMDPTPFVPGELQQHAYMYAQTTQDGEVELQFDPIVSSIPPLTIPALLADPMAILQEGFAQIEAHRKIRLPEMPVDGSIRSIDHLVSEVSRLVSVAEPDVVFFLISCFLLRPCAPDRRAVLASAYHLSSDLVPMAELLSQRRLPDGWQKPIDDVMDVLRRIDRSALASDALAQYGSEDAVPYLYERFLAVEDPALRNRSGAFYTPAPLAGFLAEGLHALLPDAGCPAGLADPTVRMIDPWAGTQVLLGAMIQKAIECDASPEGLIGRCSAMELLPVAAHIGNLRIAFLLRPQHPCDPCTLVGNSLTDPDALTCLDVGDAPLALCSSPPFNQFSQTTLPHDSPQERIYARYCGGRTGADIPHALRDDYVQSLALAHAALMRAGSGVAALILRSTWLHSEACHDLRRALEEDFEELYILNLHGDAKGRLQAPGGRDENVFDMFYDVGVCILFLVLAPGHPRGMLYADLFGDRSMKYDVLETLPFHALPWKHVVSLDRRPL